MSTSILKSLLAASLFCAFAAEPAYALLELRAEVWTDSEKISPSVIVLEDTWTDVETDTLTVRLRASKTADNKASVQAEIIRNVQGGAPKVLGKPGLTMNWNEAAEVAAAQDDGNLIYRLRVTAAPVAPPPAPPKAN